MIITKKKKGYKNGIISLILELLILPWAWLLCLSYISIFHSFQQTKKEKTGYINSYVVDIYLVLDIYDMLL